jgi:CRP-like cAMP-binding protein
MEKPDLIRQVPLFRDLDDTDILKLAEIATIESLMVGGRVFAEGSSGDSLFIIKYGTVRILKRGKEDDEEVARMSAGQHFGEMALIDNETRSATVYAIEHTELVRIGRDELEELLAQDDALGQRIYRAFSRYLCRRLRQTTTDLTFMREVAKRRHS